MPYTLTYTIMPFTGQTGTVIETVPLTLGIDGSGWQPGEATVTANGPTGISVSANGSVGLNIRIVDGTRSGAYYPVGLAVQPVQGGSRVTPFPVAQVSSDGSSIQLTDNNRAGTGPGTYEFVVLFQAVNGNFGWLDPRIVNDGN